MTNDLFKNTTLDFLRALDDSPTMRAIRALEESPTMRMIREIDNSPVLRLMQEIEDSPSMRLIQQIEESPAMRIMRDLENSPSLQIARDLENSAAFRAIRDLQDSPALKAIKALEVSPSFAAFSRISEQINKNYGALTFSEAYQFLVDEIEVAKDDSSLIEDLKDKSSRAPLSPLSAEFYLSLIFALFLYYLSQVSATESEERLLERMGVLEQTISTQLQALESKEASSIFLVTDRELNFRDGPSMDSKVLEVLPRNKKVIEITRQKDWIQVEYFDYVNNLNKVGWVHSGYVIQVDVSKKQ
ncbi:SH3 domain-containing protein [Shewanella indica]|uniref:SH3 domain-containing protein n=1 Tax=Shewanella indica TaxID=768528 RepID=A0ABU4QDQ1_9GAMM|nr:SH3 domain-containing protein [Shewanella indica]MDX6017158.1 SH3 domain-containing protein [Shewanella indica]